MAKAYLISFCIAPLLAAISFATAVIDRGVAIVLDFGETMLRILAEPIRIVEGWGGDIVQTGPLAYAGPASIHELRHEAGSPRRGSARHI